MTPAQNYLAKLLGRHSDGKGIYGVSCPPATSPAVHLSKFLGVHADGRGMHGYGASELGSGKVLLSKFAGYHTDGKAVHLVAGCGNVPCQYCEGGILPNNVIATISGAVGACCSTVNGTHVLPASPTIECDLRNIFPGGCAGYSIAVAFSATGISGFISVFDPDISCNVTSQFSLSASAPHDCFSASGFDLTFQSQFVLCSADCDFSGVSLHVVAA